MRRENFLGESELTGRVSLEPISTRAKPFGIQTCCYIASYFGIHVISGLTAPFSLLDFPPFFSSKDLIVLCVKLRMSIKRHKGHPDELQFSHFLEICFVFSSVAKFRASRSDEAASESGVGSDLGVARLLDVGVLDRQSEFLSDEL